MNRMRRVLLLLSVLWISSLGLTVVRAESENPTVVRRVLLVPPAWIERTPPVERINGPEFLSAAYPGQPVQAAVLIGGAEGSGRDASPEGWSGRVIFEIGGNESAEPIDGENTQVRRIKAVGADMVQQVMQAAGLKEASGELAEKSAPQTLVILPLTWTVPMSAMDGTLNVSIELKDTDGPLAVLPITLPIATGATATASDSTQDIGAVGREMTRFHAAQDPARVLRWFRALAGTPALRGPAVYSYFVHSWREMPALRAAAIGTFDQLETAAQDDLLITLRLAGIELAKALPLVPAERLQRFERMAPMPDPRSLTAFTDPVDPGAVRALGNTMDMCWSGWTATGDVSYLRTLVSLLGHPEDLAALEAWKEAKTGLKGLNAQVANGLAYQIAGWSIGLFMRSDPLVADWVAYWREDPAQPEVIRHELAGLVSNPAFRRDPPAAKR